jgi:hypothetical protein
VNINWQPINKESFFKKKNYFTLSLRLVLNSCHCMRLSNCLYILINVLVFFPALSPAQPSDSLLLSRSIDKAKSLYFKEAGENAHIFTGSEYIASDYGISGSRFFLSPMPQTGSVFFQEEYFPNVPLYYDLLTDRLITHRFTQMYRIWLPQDKVEYFTLAGHHFVRLVPDSAHRGSIESGYYELLYAGKSPAYLRRKRVIDEKVTAEGTFTKLIEKDNYYVRKGGEYYKVNNKKSLLRTFKDRKKEIRKFLRKNDLSFSKDPGEAIAKGASFYDQLNK